MRTMAIVIIGLVLGGCLSYGSESIVDRGTDWPPLTMTRQAMIEALGPPSQQTTETKDGRTNETVTWIHADAAVSPASFIPVVGLFVMASGNGYNGQTRILSAVFGSDGQMLSRSWSQGIIGKP